MPKNDKPMIHDVISKAAKDLQESTKDLKKLGAPTKGGK